MKLLLTAAFCLTSLMCLCQVRGENENGHTRDNFNLQKKRIQKMLSENPLLANKQGNIAFLPQDRMPCIVPDSATMRPMPNVWLGVQVPYKPQHHAIPNPSTRIWSSRYNVLDDGLLRFKK